MILKAYEITGQRTMEKVSPGALSSESYKDGTHRWLDIEGGDPEALREFLVPFDLHPLVVEACTESGSGVRFASYENALYIEFSVLIAAGHLQLSRISIICLPTTLITIHDGTVPAMAAVVSDLSSKRRLHTPTTSALLYHLFDFVADRITWGVGPSKERARAIAKALNEDPDSVEIGEILTLKTLAGDVVDVLESVVFCVMRLQTVTSKAFEPSELGLYLKDLASTLQNVLSASQRFESSLSDLHQQFVLTQQDKMNSRLQILTVISAVFLPLTLLAGIYGMNFTHMPELEWVYGYPLLLGMMVVVAMVMLLVFRFRGWFK